MASFLLLLIFRFYESHFFDAQKNERCEKRESFSNSNPVYS
jgi:hypothetical protein